MRLEIGNFPVTRLLFGPEARWDAGVLTIDKAALVSAIADPAFSRVDVELVCPGEDARIVHVLDAVEPRVKVDGARDAYPGWQDPVELTGAGRTHRLPNVAVLASCEVPWRSLGGLLMVREGIIDMRGHAAMYSPFAGTHNIVLLLEPAPGLSDDEYERATRMAALGAAAQVAACLRTLSPETIDSFELGAVDPSLPKVAYIYQIQSQGIWARTFLYGHGLDEQLPTLVHPNEILDGALVSGNQVYQNHKIPTWLHANNPVILDLYRRHGRDLQFAGVVLARGFFYADAAKRRSALLSARLAAMLGAEGAVVTWEGGGNSMIEAMMTVQACEARGIRTCILAYEMSGVGGDQPPLLYAVPEAEAIVSTGNSEEPVRLPPVARAVGGDTIRLRPELGGIRKPATEALDLEMTFEMYCAANRLGAGRFQSVER